MTFPKNKLFAGEHKVGYGSGDPGGRPHGMTAGRATALVLKEAYRAVNVREGDKFITLPAIQAVLRSQVAPRRQGQRPRPAHRDNLAGRHARSAPSRTSVEFALRVSAIERFASGPNLIPIWV